jgi:hypothetical protein
MLEFANTMVLAAAILWIGTGIERSTRELTDTLRELKELLQK